MLSEEQLRKKFAEKLILYRKSAGMTQLELAEKLNYSDKSVSKWERGDGIPDLYVMLQIAELFGVTVNELISDTPVKRRLLTHNKVLTTLIALGLPWLLATILSFVFEIALPEFPSFCFYICAIPLDAIVAIIFTCLWWSKPLQFLSVSALIWTLPTALYIVLITFIKVSDFWLIYFIATVLQVLTLLWYLRKKQ